MIKNLWKKIILICGNGHEEDVIMKEKIGIKSLFYTCPKYYPENRNNSERACVNNIPLDDFEKMVNHLSDKIENESMQGNNVCLKNYTWKMKSYTFEVIEHNNECIKIKMLNKKALK